MYVDVLFYIEKKRVVEMYENKKKETFYIVIVYNILDLGLLTLGSVFALGRLL